MHQPSLADSSLMVFNIIAILAVGFMLLGVISDYILPFISSKVLVRKPRPAATYRREGSKWLHR